MTGAEPQPKRRLEPAVTGETACPTKNRRGVQKNEDARAKKLMDSNSRWSRDGLLADGDVADEVAV
jgi:hypothetical protein